MSARHQMTMRALIERDGNQTPDAYGQPDAPIWYTHIAIQPCYFWEPSGQRGEMVGERNADIYAHRCIMPLGVDVTEQDRIVTIRDRRGRTISDSTFDITQIVRKPDHLLLVLAVVES